MNSIVLFIIIIVIANVMKAVKQSRTDAKQGSTDTKGWTTSWPTDTPVTQRKPTSYNATASKPYNPTPVEKQTVYKKQHNAAEMKQGATQSTVDYLSQKAAQEDKDQRMEVKMNASVRVGGRRVAVQLIEGDMAPMGTRVIKCGYCGAENLVPMTTSEEYACFFCREDL
ncbi:MAG: hypothetical protein PHS74_07035 [Lachnospiraceae bacterium]|nr:hypothetical protein [Lachnospiraceae bacterium]